MTWVMMPFARFGDFAGRSRRLEFWTFWIMLLLAQLIATYIDAFRGGPITIAGMGLIATILNSVTLIPGAAVTVRRLHDIGRTGLWALLLGGPNLAFLLWPDSGVVAVMLLGGILALLILTVQPGQASENAYGPNPKGDRRKTVADTDHADYGGS